MNPRITRSTPHHPAEVRRLTFLLFGVIAVVLVTVHLLPFGGILLEGTVSPDLGAAILGVVAGIGITIAVAVLGGVRTDKSSIDDDHLHHLTEILLLLAMLTAATGLLVLVGGDPGRMSAERTLTAAASGLVALILMSGSAVVPEQVSKGYVDRRSALRRARLRNAVQHLERTRSSRRSLLLSTVSLTGLSCLPTAAVVLLGGAAADLRPVLGATLVLTAFSTIAVLTSVLGLAWTSLLMSLISTLMIVICALAPLLVLWRQGAHVIDWRILTAVWFLTVAGWVGTVAVGLRPDGGLRSAQLLLLRLAVRIDEPRDVDRDSSGRWQRRWSEIADEIRRMAGRVVVNDKDS